MKTNVEVNRVEAYLLDPTCHNIPRQDVMRLLANLTAQIGSVKTNRSCNGVGAVRRGGSVPTFSFDN